MNNNYFIYNNVKYVSIYKDKNITFYKYINDKIEPLTEEEKKVIEELLNNNYSFIYSSKKLTNIINANNGIDNKDLMTKYLEWLEQRIPEGCRENFYRNLDTLKINIKSGDEFKKISPDAKGGYNSSDNTINIDMDYFKDVWNIAQNNPNPEQFFWAEYSDMLLHELSHMASSRFDTENNISYSGFDKFPPYTDDDKNRGLTEGFTESLALSGSPGKVEYASGYYIEASLVNQLCQLTGYEVFMKSYFSNSGITPIQEKLCEIINNPEMSSQLFRSIELNFQLRDINIDQNILGNIQSTILDYLDKKIELLQAENKNDEISQMITNFNKLIITPETLEILRKDPALFVGIEECITKFNDIKNKYQINQLDDNQMSGISK